MAPVRQSDHRIDTLKSGYNWSPDSKEIALPLGWPTAQSRRRHKTSYGVGFLELWNIVRLSGRLTESGSLIRVGRHPHVRYLPNCCLRAEKEPHKLTFDSNSDTTSKVFPDGLKLFFQRLKPPVEPLLFGSDLLVTLERLDRDPDDPEETNEPEASPRGRRGRL